MSIGRQPSSRLSLASVTGLRARLMCLVVGPCATGSRSTEPVRTLIGAILLPIVVSEHRAIMGRGLFLRLERTTGPER